MSGPLDRRAFFRRSGLLAASTVAAPAIVHAAGPTLFRPGAKPKHIIHMVSDGMSTGTLTCSDYLSQIVRKKELTWMELYRRPGTTAGMMNMRSLNSLVTDSSAASSSWGTGSRIVNGAVNMLPDGRKLTHLYALFGQKGWKRGLITTTEITHATPAGFAAHDDSRGSSDAIAAQYLIEGIEVLLGGGAKFFDPAARKDKKDLRGAFRDSGYAVMETAAELRAAPLDKKWLGTFNRSHLPYTIDHRENPQWQERIPTLAEMTRRALDRLGRSRHFILEVEGGRVDHACHGGDAAGAFVDQIAFDEAIDVCLEFQRKEPETLIVITTDHGTGNPGLNATGSKYALSTPLFHNLTKVKASLETIMKRLKPSPTGPTDTGYEDAAEEPEVKMSTPTVPVEKVMEIVEELTGQTMTRKKADLLYPFLERKGQTMYDSMNNPYAQLSQWLANRTGVGWIGIVHTGDYVQVAATGPGAERFRGFIQNTDVFRHYTALAGIDFKNPELPLMAECGPSANETEALAWV